MTSGDVMDESAAFLNDANKTSFTYTAQLPFLNQAVRDLLEEMELNNYAVTNKSDSSFTINVGVTDIGGPTGPPLPLGLVEIQELVERLSGTTEDYLPMVRRDFLPDFGPPEIIESLVYWAWIDQKITFVGALTVRQVKVKYIRSVIPPITETNGTTIIPIINAQSFLAYRTAALCAMFLGENKSRADDLNGGAVMALDKFLGLGSKGRQSVYTRRKPFLAGYKIRAGW
jgi:hypothetical protein